MGKELNKKNPKEFTDEIFNIDVNDPLSENSLEKKKKESPANEEEGIDDKKIEKQEEGSQINELQAIANLVEELKSGGKFEVKTTLTVPKDLLSVVDILAKNYGRTTSHYVSSMIIYLLRKNKKEYARILKKVEIKNKSLM